ncbi:MAG: gliding motility-associated C-terminal domain-containing protein, partial [Saprospiraceae bacterium]|nr:gliding motility-associated C-terminal domain-containing protein [Saprospiraceae bacterium]
MHLLLTLFSILFHLFQYLPEGKHIYPGPTNMDNLSQVPMMVCDRRSDSLELVKFYNATGGPNWWKKWDLNKPINTWLGIKINNEGCITGIYLSDTLRDSDHSGNNLIGTILPLNLPNLSELDLHNNKLSGNLSNFETLTSLKFLSVFGNQFIGTIPNFNLPSLEVLNIGSNQLIDIIPNFSKLPNLEYLEITYNQVTGSIPDFDKLPRLKWLILQYNKLTGNIPNFSKIPSLKVIQFYENQLNGTIPNFDKMSNLQQLILNNNKLIGTIPNFNKLPNLENLDLSNNQLSGFIPNFDNLQNLQSLYIQSNQLSGTIPNHNSYNTKLTEYFLHNNKFTFSSIITNLNRLKNLIDITNKVCPTCSDTLVYAPQQKIYKDTIILISSNINYTLNLLIDDTVTTSTYTWYKNDILYKTFKGSNKLPFTPFTANDAGTYTVKITNPIAPQLTLESWPIRLVVGPNLVCDRRSDSLELVKFYNVTGGPNWINKWDPIKPINTWQGIQLNSKGCVIKIILINNNLVGTIPDLILIELQELSLLNHKLTGAIPDFNNLPNLSQLNLRNNNLFGTIPSFSKVPKLGDIDLSLNQFSDILPDLSHLSTLSNIRLYFNHLEGEIPSFSSNPLLQTIQLNDNKFTGKIPNFINHKDLINVWLHNNKLSGPLPAFFINNPKISYLTVQENNLIFSHLIHNISKNKTQTDITNQDCPACKDDTLIYAPQKKVFADTTITILINTNYTIDLKIDDTVTTSTYTWYKNNAVYKTIKGSNKLPFTPFTSNDAGTYTVKINNPLAPQLTLESWPIRLNIKEGCPGTSAGTFKINRNVSNQSPNIKYLCFGDQLSITHNRDANFSGDPNPNTTPGIAYVFYDCKPTIDGPNLATVINDPCLNKKSPVIINGIPVNQTQGMWIARGNVNGDIDILNDGYLQNTYNNRKPTQFWFASITLDQWTTDNKPQFETDVNGVPGPCIDVNTDSAFSVVFFNKVEISNIAGRNGGMGNYTGTLTISGGLPEFDPTANYPTVRIENLFDPSKIGSITNGPALHGKPMTFTVPKPGRYQISVEDGTGCSHSERYIVLIASDSGLVKIKCKDARVGETVCIPITLGKMKELTAAKFTFLFNPLVFQYVRAQNLNSGLGSDLKQTVVEDQKNSGIIKLLWFDPKSLPRDFTNESVLIEFCFIVKGPPGLSEFRITGSPVSLEFADIGGNPYPLGEGNGSLFKCSSMVSPGSNLDAYFSQCGQTMFINIFGGKGPYTVKWEREINPANNVFKTFMADGIPDTLMINQPPGRYFISITDSSGFNIKDTVTVIGGLANLGVNLSLRENSSCKVNDGRIIVAATGGTPAYKFQWSTGSVSDRALQLVTGNYYLTVTDAQGCKKSDSFLINQINVKAAISIQKNPTNSCSKDGVISPDFSKISGLPPFTVRWEGEGFQIGNSFAGLGTSLNKLIVTDFKGCADTSSIILIPNTKFEIALRNDNQKVKHQTPQLFDVIANDIITKGTNLNITIDNPQNGSIIYSQSSGKGTYTPGKGFSGKELLNYTVCATDCANACKSSTIEFLVEGPCGDRNSLVLPNVIFPTGSGPNRYFIVEAIQKCPDAWGPRPHKLQVFNRWGDQVFRNNNYLNDWDGT